MRDPGKKPTLSRADSRSIATTNPLRRLWIAYAGFVALEGLLLVIGLTGVMITINTYLIYKGGAGLGYFMLVPALFIAWLAVIGIMHPLSLWKRAHRVPKTQHLFSTLQIVIPAIKSKELTEEKARELVGSRSAFELLDKSRFWRNLAIFVVGVAGVGYLYTL